ncbi:hypothetical protein OHA70_14235 [Kribbella sp. NBC_00382]|uniref:hypothetical protein n=1 Tax=Kribbella sp. NBC_00382 TaxID=2975967 RepID=UPI002E20BF92
MRVAAVALLALGILSSSALTASAVLSLQPGWNLWTREYCEAGTLVSLRHLHLESEPSRLQGREYVYRRGGRLCAFTADHAAGDHNIQIWGRRDTGDWSVEYGNFSEYAGALAAPQGYCIHVTAYLEYGPGWWTTPEKRFC